MEFLAVIKKGESQFVAVCPEIDVANQGRTIEKALTNLKEAVELYLEENETPDGIGSEKPIITSFTVKSNPKAAEQKAKIEINRMKKGFKLGYKPIKRAKMWRL